MDAYEDDESVKRAELFDVLGHPTRIKILKTLQRSPMTFAELKRALDIESSGNLQHHLGKLGDLVKQTDDGKYTINDDAKEALRLVDSIEQTQKHAPGGSPPAESRKTKLSVFGFAVVSALLLVTSLYEYSLILSSRARPTVLTVPPLGTFTVGRDLRAGDKVQGIIDVAGGGGNGIDFYVFDSQNNKILAYSRISRVNFEFTAQTSGAYYLIFDNSFSSTSSTYVALDYNVYFLSIIPVSMLSADLLGVAIGIGFSVALLLYLGKILGMKTPKEEAALPLARAG